MYMYQRLLDSGWMTDGGIHIGSASFHPFALIRETNLGMNTMLRIPQGERSAWRFSLTLYSPMSKL